MCRRLAISSVVVLVLLALGGCGSQARSPSPPRSTPLNSTLGWFKAINAHNRRELVSYVAPVDIDQMGWARPSAPWAKFTHLRCRTLAGSNHSHAQIYCAFDESGTPAEEGNPDTFWDVELLHTRDGWLIDSYGQG